MTKSILLYHIDVIGKFLGEVMVTCKCHNTGIQMNTFAEGHIPCSWLDFEGSAPTVIFVLYFLLVPHLENRINKYILKKELKN